GAVHLAELVAGGEVLLLGAGAPEELLRLLGLLLGDLALAVEASQLEAVELVTGLARLGERLDPLGGVLRHALALDVALGELRAVETTPEVAGLADVEERLEQVRRVVGAVLFQGAHLDRRA